ncbi:MAG: cupin domain-containing protein [Actinobacteria bacterium]|nr:cupin domain-containing protein [Actinomycetota bacterium]
MSVFDDHGKSLIFAKMVSERIHLGSPGRTNYIILDPRKSDVRRMSLGVTELEPSGEISFHTHDNEEEVLYCYDGYGEIVIGNRSYEFKEGVAAFIPQGVIHGFRNLSSKKLSWVWVFSPPGYEDVIRGKARKEGEKNIPRKRDRVDLEEKAKLEKLGKKAKEIRRGVIKLFGKACGGHFGGSLSAVEIITTLYYGILRIKPEDPAWQDRDRFVLSKGHASPTLYMALADRGYFPCEVLNGFEELNNPLTMHPNMKKCRGIDISTGSMGHGLSIAAGMALAGKMDKKDYRVFVLLGDGELQEGSVWEAAMFASHNKLDNLIAVVDRNRLSVDGFVENIVSIEPLAERWRSFGWSVREADGHSVSQLYAMLTDIPFMSNKPGLLIAHTVKGKGIPFMENRREYHRADITPEQLSTALAAIESEE